MPLKLLDATISTFDSVFEKFRAEAPKNKANLILFLADKDPSTSLSWCPGNYLIYFKIEFSFQFCVFILCDKITSARDRVLVKFFDSIVISFHIRKSKSRNFINRLRKLIWTLRGSHSKSHNFKSLRNHPVGVFRCVNSAPSFMFLKNLVIIDFFQFTVRLTLRD